MFLSPLQEEILHALVDRYEKRSDYGSEQKSPSRTLIKVNGRNYPAYFHVSDSSYRLTFNAEMQQLEEHALVSLDWERFSEGENLQRIALTVEALPAIYKLLGRRTKKEIYYTAASLLEEWKKEAPVELQPFYRYILEQLYHLKALPKVIKPGQDEDLIQLIKGLHACFEPRKSEIPKRLLSVRLYGDSKRWQALEKSIIGIIRNFCLDGKETSYSDEEILGEKGIVDNPVHINLAGPMVFSTDRGRVDLSSFYPDLGLSSEMAGDLFIEKCSADAVVTVENKTSFYQYIKEITSNHLVLYLGGYHNSPRREILQKLYNYLITVNKQIHFYHWGDMDLGGITIWNDLKDKTGIPFQPIYMDVETYYRFFERGYPIDDSYCRKLAKLLENPSLEIFHPLIQQMIENKICIEQEAVVIGDSSLAP